VGYALILHGIPTGRWLLRGVILSRVITHAEIHLWSGDSSSKSKPSHHDAASGPGRKALRDLCITPLIRRHLPANAETVARFLHGKQGRAEPRGNGSTDLREHGVYMAKTTVELPEAMHRKLRVKAALENRSMNEIVLAALKNYLHNFRLEPEMLEVETVQTERSARRTVSQEV
jgi:plasmid stability protein